MVRAILHTFGFLYISFNQWKFAYQFGRYFGSCCLFCFGRYFFKKKIGCPDALIFSIEDPTQLPMLKTASRVVRISRRWISQCREILSRCILPDLHPDAHLCVERSFPDAFSYISRWLYALGDPKLLVVSTLVVRN